MLDGLLFGFVGIAVLFSATKPKNALDGMIMPLMYLAIAGMAVEGFNMFFRESKGGWNTATAQKRMDERTKFICPTPSIDDCYKVLLPGPRTIKGRYDRRRHPRNRSKE